MAASYPSAVKTFTPKADGPGNTILAAHINDLQDEVTAMQSDLITDGVGHNVFPDATASARTLGTATKKFTALYLSDDATITGPVGRVLDRDVVVAEVVSSTANTSVYAYTVPAGTLGTTRGLRLSAIADYLNNDGANRNCTIKVNWGSTTIFNSGLMSIANSASRRGILIDCLLSAANATGAQVARTTLTIGAAGTDAGAGAAATSVLSAVHNAAAEDSTAAKSLSIVVEHGTASANISFKAHAVIVEGLL